ncbi:CD225/dispanin family protein [Kineosporia sp. NBRC 101731]|uniref:CD225/dispanin family protein n=1 Tax=Kineosporia sp. NBRC 101731 TaxID=3032199 RepID=UPI0024A4A9DC|nr:CD225/dispanin family protein [Kineosporia sp. NBRC 101731]GLY29208.1 hypothetical protein Kisp02_25730 [Kineosporia sp. NBRC 101731]
MSEPGTPRPEDDWNTSNPQNPPPYGQPPYGNQQSSDGQPADGGGYSPYGQAAGDGQQPPYGQSPYGGQPPYGQQPPPGQPYGQSPPPYGQTPYHQGAYGQSPNQPWQQTGQPHGNPYALRPNIPTYLAGAILVTLFCCLPTGIASIVYAAQVNSRLAAGDVAGAQQSSDKARTWMIASIVLGLVGVILWFLLAVLGSTSP